MWKWAIFQSESSSMASASRKLTETFQLSSIFFCFNPFFAVKHILRSLSTVCYCEACIFSIAQSHCISAFEISKSYCNLLHFFVDKNRIIWYNRKSARKQKKKEHPIKVKWWNWHCSIANLNVIFNKNLMLFLYR